MDKTTNEGSQTGGPVDRIVRCTLAVARWAALVGAGLVMWFFGLMALDVPVELPQWRHVAGAALLVCAVHLWRQAARPDLRR
jgi:hypothetical protein